MSLISTIRNVRNYVAIKDFENFDETKQAGKGFNYINGPLGQNFKDGSLETVNFFVSGIPIASQCVGALTAGYGLYKLAKGGLSAWFGKKTGAAEAAYSGLMSIAAGLATAAPLPFLGKIVNGALLAKDGIDVLNHAIPCGLSKKV